jgi:hypothetical protein
MPEGVIYASRAFQGMALRFASIFSYADDTLFFLAFAEKCNLPALFEESCGSTESTAWNSLWN